MGSYAYLLVNSIGDQVGTMWSSANNIGWWPSASLVLRAVRWYSPLTGSAS
jgi:hypothetical protein